MYTVKNNYKTPVQYRTLKNAWDCPEAEQIRSSIDFDKFTDLIIEHLAVGFGDGAIIYVGDIKYPCSFYCLKNEAVMVIAVLDSGNDSYQQCGESDEEYKARLNKIRNELYERLSDKEKQQINALLKEMEDIEMRGGFGVR